MAKQHCKVSIVDCKLQETHQKEGISQQLIKWAQHNDWYHNDIQTNQLRLEQSFVQAIEAITKDLDYHNQPKLRRQVFDCYDMLMAKCRQIDMVCRTGCRSEAELLELEFLRSKAVGAATELAEVLGLLQRKSGTTDFAEIQAPSVSAGIVQTQGVRISDDWITFAQAAEILGLAKGTVSKWASEAKFQDNGRKGQKRKLLKASVLLVKQKIEDEAIKGDIKELREDARKLKTLNPQR